MPPPPLPSVKERPTSVTVLAWLLLAYNVLNLDFVFSINNPLVHELMAKSPIPIPVQIGMAYVGITVKIVAAAFMLRGANWARWLYIGYCAFSLLVGLFTSPMKALLPLVLVIDIVVVVLLTRPKVNAYFTSGSSAPTAL